jgi:spore coat protein H
MTYLLLLACITEDTSTEDSGSSTEPSYIGSCDEDAVGWSEETHLKGTDGDYGLVFDGSVQRIDIALCEGDLALMHADLDEKVTSGGGGGPGGPGGGGPPEDPEDPMYVSATISHNGLVWPSVGMRFKGNSSLSQAWGRGVEKLPFRLHFDYYEDDIVEVEDQRFHGFKELKFNNGYNDNSLIRDKMMGDLLVESGVPAPRAAFVEVWVDSGDGPVFWGLYTMYEDVCGEMLDSVFGDDSGNCYKADGASATLGINDPSGYEDKTNDTDAEDVMALVEALDSGSGESWRNELEQHIDVQGFLLAFAVNNLAGNWDTYGQMTHNYYLYADPGQGRLVWVPWDFGLAWAANNVREPNTLMMDEVSSQWPMIRNVLDDEVYRQDYIDILEELYEGVFAPDAVMARAEALTQQVSSYALAEKAPHTCIDDDFNSALYEADDAIVNWVDETTDQMP